MTNLPLPVRLAAGLAVAAVEQARRLPEQLAGLPVTVVSQALSLSMRVQQQVTELAIKGDEALSGLRAPEENPEWATFDEDLAPEGTAAGDARPNRSDGQDRSEPTRASDADDTETDDLDDFDDALAVDALGNGSFGVPVTGDTAGPGPAKSERTGTATRTRTPASTAKRAHPDYEDLEDPIDDADPGRSLVEPRRAEAVLISEEPVTGYDGFSLAQLRGRLRGFSPEQLRALLAYEKSGTARPDYVRMLSNRLATVSAE
ncbi:lipid droplet-associated protein [Actinoalloteichus hymeniacidonis]|uniref:Lipid droplet-associated protein n=1 Tax=Actinoalloteichus hymeniacidonis TaxID=340345 RepID=A0AAC9HMX0_9PSEU|nr:lipid droplet-associated protein [Actinoalloteichus hymeniacidonis]AOS61671.1 hypothetical protein TL08_04205 [Actinoalloteichus hymeniacidonis]MBB5910315.1 hypothetical protein [Actinoalloteichus hymeniacidonis]